MLGKKFYTTAAAAVFVVTLSAAGIGCSFTLQREPAPQLQIVEDGGDAEEVLEKDDDVFGENPEGATGTAGEILVAVGYVGWILAAAVLPLLLLF